MISDAKVAGLDQLARCFLQIARERLDSAFEEQLTDRLVVTVPARHPRVGNLVISADGDALTLHLGEIFHWHFNIAPERSLSDGTPEATARETVQFIDELLADRIRIRVDFEGGRPGAGSAVSIDAPATPRSSTEQDFVWSGPLS